MSSGDWVALAPEWLRLKAYWAYVKAEVATAFISSGARHGLTSTVGTIDYWLQRLGPDGELGKGVVAGTVTPERWVRVANEQGRALQQVLRDVYGENLLVRAWGEIIVPTVKDAGALASTALDRGESILGKLVVLFGLYVALRALQVIR